MKLACHSKDEGKVLLEEDFSFSEASGSVLLPACREHRLHLLRPLLDGVIPRQSRLLRESRHGLDQLVNLCTEQNLPIAGLKCLNVIRPAEIPTFYRDLICRAVNGKPEVIGLAAKDEIKRIDRRIEDCPILITDERIQVDNRILAIAAREIIDILAGVTSHRIVAGTAGKLIGATAAGHHVVTGSATQLVIARSTNQDIHSISAAQRIVSAAAQQNVIPRPAIDCIVSRAAIQNMGLM